jgi:hypothetical protein
MIKRDRVGGLFFLFLGFYVCLHAHHLGLGRFQEPGPGLIFFIAGALLSLFSVIDLLSTLFSRQKGEPPAASSWGPRWPKIIIVLIGLCAWVFSLDFLGFFLCTFLLLVFLFRIVEPVRWWLAIVSAFLTISASYAVFELWLKVPFPRGIAGI